MLLVSGNFLFAQTIKGKVTDSIQKPIPFVSVYLKELQNDVIVNFTTSNENGDYILKTNQTGDFELSFSSISYLTESFKIKLEKNKTHTINPKLKNNTFSLDEVIINSEKAITIKEDTIIYKAAAFKKGNEEVVEDLLRNLPGVSVSEDGTIKVKNREIEKIMVDGDDLFKKGYKLLTKNLEAQAVDRVEVYDHYSTNRLLKGIEESDKIAINLTLKDSYKNQVSAMLRPGYGLASENRYDSKANLIAFQKKSKTYGFFNFNNIGEDVMGENLQKFISIDDNPSKTNKAYSFIDLVQHPPDLGKERTNFNNAELVSLNNIYKLNKNMTFKTIGFLNWDEMDFYRNSSQTYYLQESTFTNTEDYSLRNKKLKAFLKTGFSFDISKTQTLNYEGSYASLSEKINTDLLFNQNHSNESLRNKNFTSFQELRYSHKITKSKALTLKGHFLFDQKPQDYQNNRFFFPQLFQIQDSIQEVRQKSIDRSIDAALIGSFYNRSTSGHFSKIIAGINYKTHHLNSHFDLLLSENSMNSLSTNFKNKLDYQQYQAYILPSYSLKAGNFRFTGEVNLQVNYNELSNNNQAKKSNSLFINPKISTDWKIGEMHHLNAFYSYGSKNPEVNHLNSNYILTDYNTFSRGTLDLTPVKASTYFLNYMAGTPVSTFYANTTFLYRNTRNYQALNSAINPQYLLTNYFRGNDKSLLNIQTELNFYWEDASVNTKAILNYTNQEYQNLVNGDLRDIELSTYNYGVEFRSAFTKSFNFHLGTTWFYHKIQSLNTQNNTTNKTFIDLVYKPFKKITFSLNNERFYFSNLRNTKHSYYFMDAETKYTVLKNKFSVGIVGKNLLNTKTYRNLNITDTRRLVSSYRLLERFFLLKVTIHI